MPSSTTVMPPDAGNSNGSPRIETMHRRPSVEAVTGLSRSTLYEMMDRGDFPRPIRIGRRAVAWRESDIIEWINSRKSTAA